MSRTISHKAVHEELAQTIAARRQLFGRYSSSFGAHKGERDVHFQLQQTIREHKAAMHHLYLKMHTANSKQAA
jgi:hypothetical protein